MDNKQGIISVYRVVPVGLYGLRLHEEPRIPESAAMEEDQHIPRIPVCLTIPSAIEAAELVYNADLFDTAYKHFCDEFAAAIGRIDNEWSTVKDPDFIPTSFGTFHRTYVPNSGRDLGIRFDVLVAKVPAEKLYQPSVVEVPDVWKTGEIWLLEPTDFEHYGRYIMSRHMFIGNTAYARYAVTELKPDPSKAGRYLEDYDEVIDRNVATAIYGEEEAFSFITMDPQLAADVREESDEGEDDD